MTDRKSPGRERLGPEDVLIRWPRLVAHLICESNGYLSPIAAANAIAAYREGQVFACEWYLALASGTGRRMDDETLLHVNGRVIAAAFHRRRFHRGFMASYPRARALVHQAASGGDPFPFGSW